MRSSAVKKTAAILQITAMLLLQFYAVTPRLSRTFSALSGVMRCNGNHTQCGCSSTRIASRTCCCFQSKQLIRTSTTTPETAQVNSPDIHTDHNELPGAAAKSEELNDGKPDCCPKDTQPTVTGQFHRNDLAYNPGSSKTEPRVKGPQERTLSFVCSTPCGGDPAVTSASLDTLKYLCSSIPEADPATLTAEFQIPCPTLFQNRFLEPPDPPPRLSLFS